jgi:hypothetical protein
MDIAIGSLSLQKTVDDFQSYQSPTLASDLRNAVQTLYSFDNQVSLTDYIKLTKQCQTIAVRHSSREMISNFN